MHLGELGEQIVLISQKAFSHIEYLGNESADSSIYYSQKSNRDKRAKQAYRFEKNAVANLDELFILDIMRGNIQNGDPRIQ